MTTKLATTISLVLIVGAVIAGMLLWNHLPDPMAYHWNINGEVDDYTSKFWGVFLLPLMALGLFLLFLAVPSIDPFKANIAQFRETFNLFIVFFVAFMVYVYALTLLWNLGYTNVSINNAMMPAMGLLFILIGSLLRKSKRNFFIGIRTPWTLSSDTVWAKTHQLGAILFILTGVLTIIGGFFGGTISFWMMFVPLIGSTIFLLIYSYVLYKNETNV